MPTEQNNSCTINNNSAKDIIIALGVEVDETVTSNSIMSADGQLEILKTDAGGNVITKGSKASLTLDRSYKSATNGDAQVLNYGLQVLESNWLYPFANLPVSTHGANGGTRYNDQTVTDASQQAITQATNFYQVIAAYPDSQLARDYASALESAQNAAMEAADGSTASAGKVSAIIENTISTFFRNTTSYKNVTLADISAIDNYYNNLPCVWAQYKDDITYYIYGSDGKQSTFAGILTLRKSGALDITKPNGGYACTFVPALNPSDTSKTNVDSSRAITLRYSKSLFISKNDQAGIHVALKGSLLNKQLFTGLPEDNGMLPVLTGTIGNSTCIGFDRLQNSSENASKTNAPAALEKGPIERYWDTLTHPKDQEQLIITIMTFVGAALVLALTAHIIYRIYQIALYRKATRELLSLQIVEKTRAELNESSTLEALKFGKWCGIHENIFVEQNFKNPEGYYKVLKNDIYANDLHRAYRYQAECLKEMMKYSQLLDQDVIGDVQGTISSIHESMRILESCKRTELEIILPEEFENFRAVQKSVKVIDTKVHSKLNEEARGIIDRNIIASSNIFDNIERLREEESSELEESDPLLEEEIVPELL